MLRALDGAPDQAIADALGLSRETVRSNWRSIYRRLGSVLPGVAQATGDGEGSRGTERRRAAIECLRQNMHELRPRSRQSS